MDNILCILKERAGGGGYLDVVACAFATGSTGAGERELGFDVVLYLGRDSAEAVEGYQQHEGKVPRVHGVHGGCEHGGEDAAEGQGFARQGARDEERRGHAGEYEVHCVGCWGRGRGWVGGRGREMERRERCRLCEAEDDVSDADT